ncbi:MAG: SsrA-binding protein SmpB [bacterium]
MTPEERKKIVASNPRIFHDFWVLEQLEAGIVLQGGEIKSVREGKVSIREAFGRVEGGELFLYNAYIAPYEKESFARWEPRRKRKMLLHRKQIDRWAGKLRAGGLTVMPLEMYIINGRAKVLLGLVKAKKKYDKRREIRKREEERETRRWEKRKR